MRPAVPALLLAVALVGAGCTAPSPGVTPSNVATATPTPTHRAMPTDTPPADGTPRSDTSTPSATPVPEPVSVEYVVRPGEIPAEVRSVSLTARVVFAETARDVTRNRCWRKTYYGPFKPTPTPIGFPQGECYRSDPVTVTLTARNDTTSLGQFTAPGRFTAGHALIITDVTATHQNGTTLTRIQGRGGHRAAIVEGYPDGSHAVRIGLHAWDDPPASGGDYYALVSEPSGDAE